MPGGNVPGRRSKMVRTFLNPLRGGACTRAMKTDVALVKGEHMNSTGDDQGGNSRRSFLRSSGGWLTGAWIAAHWPAIADAAHHAAEASSASAPAGFEFLSAADAADVDAISAQIVPSGATPGAREAHAVHFIDRALATFFSDWSQDFRAGLAQFQSAYRASKRRQEAGADARRAPAGRGPGWPESIPASASFAQAAPDAQTA